MTPLSQTTCKFLLLKKKSFDSKICAEISAFVYASDLGYARVFMLVCVVHILQKSNLSNEMKVKGRSLGGTSRRALTAGFSSCPTQARKTGLEHCHTSLPGKAERSAKGTTECIFSSLNDDS
jgi:hypothetical protein